MKKMFNNTPGNDTCLQYNNKLLEGAELYHTKPFHIPKIHKETLKIEVINR